MTDVTASAFADALRDRYRLTGELGRDGMAADDSSLSFDGYTCRL